MRKGRLSVAVYQNLLEYFIHCKGLVNASISRKILLNIPYDSIIFYGRIAGQTTIKFFFEGLIGIRDTEALQSRNDLFASSAS